MQTFTESVRKLVGFSGVKSVSEEPPQSVGVGARIKQILELRSAEAHGMS